jgi:type III pantothenate kinase
MYLLIDIGNTRIKWAWLDAHGLGEQSAAAHADWTSRQVNDQVLASDTAPARVLVANVSGPRMAELLCEALQERWQIAPTFVASAAAACGVSNGYADYRKLGVDRWLGVIAAHASGTRAFCVVSVGTAMTVDGVTADGRHVGGVIVPGPDLMCSTLMRHTSDILKHAQDGVAGKELFADNTLGAVRQGALHALAALIERAVESMRSELKETPVLLLTGGAATSVQHLLAMTSTVVPDLVIRGLAVIAAAE